jgi:hypothetical protein
VGWAVPARADAVTYWNDVAVQAVTSGRPGGQGFLDVALVQAAVHDAVQAIQRRFQPYHATLQGAGSPDAAVAAAAYGVLIGIYPKQQDVLETKYKAFLASSGLAGDAGLAVGQRAAAALLKQYRPVVALPDYTGGTCGSCARLSSIPLDWPVNGMPSSLASLVDTHHVERLPARLSPDCVGLPIAPGRSRARA